VRPDDLPELVAERLDRRDEVAGAEARRLLVAYGGQPVRRGEAIAVADRQKYSVQRSQRPSSYSFN
jgi:hypothetical protein